MGEVAATGKTKFIHYMQFPYTVRELTREDFEMTLLVNGEERKDIPIDVKELPKTNYSIYVFSFVNTGLDFSNWTLIVSNPDDLQKYWVETWEVRKQTTETNVKQIRNRQDSEGGFFKSSYDI